ncbi:MAG: mucin desulfatase, partial [Oscillospiraceae bacterium]|nr:mucin desulfatase [Oscillospiraceae bacterium]
MNEKQLREISAQFAFAGEPVSFHVCENGHINGTYFVDCAGGEKYVVQQINTSIFTRPDEVMENILGVTAFLKKK